MLDKIIVKEICFYQIVCYKLISSNGGIKGNNNNGGSNGGIKGILVPLTNVFNIFQ